MRGKENIIAVLRDIFIIGKRIERTYTQNTMRKGKKKTRNTDTEQEEQEEDEMKI